MTALAGQALHKFVVDFIYITFIMNKKQQGGL